MNYWLVKSEPESYSWDKFIKEKRTAWTGVRNFQARNNLRAMKCGDFVFFYHSVSEKQVVGVARVDGEAYPDPTATEGEWVCVNLAPLKALKKTVGLDAHLLVQATREPNTVVIHLNSDEPPAALKKTSGHTARK